MAKPKKSLSEAGKKPAKARVSSKAAGKRGAAGDNLSEGFDDDDMPPEEDVEAEAAALDADTLAAEVERQENKASEEEGEAALDDMPPLPAFAITDEATDDVEGTAMS